jgi:hypothetical protein
VSIYKKPLLTSGYENIYKTEFRKTSKGCDFQESSLMKQEHDLITIL